MKSAATDRCLRKVIVMNLSVKVSEEERQMILLALAELSLRRPGWLDALGRVADTFHGREMFDGFRETSADIISPTASVFRSAEEIARYNQTGIDL